MLFSYNKHADRLAQLVERYIDIVEVTSSSLVSVTKTTKETRLVFFDYVFELRQDLKRAVGDALVA